MNPEPKAVHAAEELSTLDLFAATHERRARAKQKRGTGSAKLIKAHDAKRQFALTIIPPRVWETRKLTIAPPFSRLCVDETYQRREIKTWVNDLSHLLRNGGDTPAIDVVYREWEAGERLWIVDGQQRYWAHWDADKPIACLVHNVKTYQEEKDLFEALNNRKRVNPNVTIHNHGGPGAKLLREVDSTPSHPLYNRIHFKSGGNGSKFSAASVAAACARYAGGKRSMGAMGDIASMDRFCSQVGGRASLGAFLLLLGRIYPAPQRASAEMLYAIGRAFGRNKVRAESVSLKNQTRLRKLHLENVKAARAKDRVNLMCAKVEKVLVGTSPLDDDDDV